ncbi:MAG TPA: hypothetical protein VFA26_17945 [Gemmataceae bacterium]|nr:hypothetical protein [Gemmataceae bacterium]
MTRIFSTLAVLTSLLLLAAFTAGVVSWWGGAAGRGASPYLVHYALGLISSLAVLFLHCLAITYFLGTGRWVKEVCLAYGLPDDLPRQTRDIKRGNTPYAILAMLLTIAAAAAGQAVQFDLWPRWLHFTLAVAALAVNGWVFTIEYRNMARNVGIIDQVMAETERIRAEHGLPTNEEAWQREGG